MKLIKKYAGFLLMLTLLVGFTSCEDDEDIYDDLMGRTWVGDLGFGTNRDPIESGIRLDNNGLAISIILFSYCILNSIYPKNSPSRYRSPRI